MIWGVEDRVEVRVEGRPAQFRSRANQARDQEEVPVPDLFSSLDDEWANFSRSIEGQRALRRMQLRTALPFKDLPALVQALRSRTDPDARDRLLHQVIRLAATDRDARRVVLQALIPGLVGVARSYRLRWGRDDADSMVVAAAWERIANYPLNRMRPAVNIIRDVQHDMHKARLREVALETVAAELSTLHQLPVLPEALARQPASDELLELVTDAVDEGTISLRGARLILLHRVVGVRTEDIARAEGRRPCTVRKHRQQAEAALAGVDVA